jgi:type IV pilus biogenesis protein CpaD/CtpE
MSAASHSKFAGALAAAALLAGCATRPDSTIVDSARGPIVVAEQRPKSRILQFCEDYEMVCILGGIAIFAATAVAIDKSGD